MEKFFDWFAIGPLVIEALKDFGVRHVPYRGSFLDVSEGQSEYLVIGVSVPLLLPEQVNVVS